MISRIILLLLLIFARGDFAHAQLRCNEIFQPLEESSSQLEVAEDKTIDVLRKIVFTPKESAEEIQQWGLTLKKNLESNQTLTLMEHTSLSYLVRTNIVHDLAMPEIESTAIELLKRSWQHYTGRAPRNEEYLDRLPNLSLAGESREAILFHFASYESAKLSQGAIFTSPLKNYVPEKADAFVFGGLLAAVTAFHYAGGDALGANLAALAVAHMASLLFVSSPVEHGLHRVVGHQVGNVRRWIQNAGSWAQVLRDVGFSHLEIHHRSTFTKSQTEQFSSDEDEAAFNQKLDSNPKLTTAMREKLRQTRLGLLLNAAGKASIVVVTAPILYALSRVLHATPAETAAMMSAMIPQIAVPAVMHASITHEKPGEIQTPALKWLTRTRMVEAISRSHWMHHWGGGRNYNLLPGADWWLGQYRRPNLKQLYKMRDQETLGSIWPSDVRKSD